MNEAPFQRWNPGFRELSATEHNRALDALEQARNINAGPGQIMEQGPQGNTHYPDDTSILIQITGGFNPYSWSEVFQTGTNLANPPKYASDAYSSESWETYVRSGTVSPLLIPAYEVNGNGGVPMNTVIKARINTVTRALEFRYDNRAAFVKVGSDFGAGWDATLTAYTFGGSGPATIGGPPLNGLNLIAGDTILISDGLGDSMTGTVTSYTPAVPPVNAILDYNITATVGSGTHPATLTTTALATLTALGTNLYPASVYDNNFNFLSNVWVSDPNGFIPTQGVYYQALSGVGILTRQLWWINRSGPVLLGVSCSPTNQPLGEFGAAL